MYIDLRPIYPKAVEAKYFPKCLFAWKVLFSHACLSLRILTLHTPSTTMSRFRFLVDNRLWDWQPQCHLACLEMFTLDDLPLGVE